MNAREIFNQVKADTKAALEAGESFSLSYESERSSFVRFNGGKVRQPTDLLQLKARVDLRNGRRHALGEITLCGDQEEDQGRINALMGDLRDTLAHVPEDPYLIVAEPQQIERVDADQLPPPTDVVDALLEEGKGLDLVGIYAAGGIFRGYADDQGADCWFESYPFHLDFSAFLEADRATKQGYAGFTFERPQLAAKMALARRDLEVLALPPKTLEPGAYRAFLSPDALNEIFGLLGWQGFSRRALETKATPLLALAMGETALNPAVTVAEDVKAGAGPGFSSSGFVRPDRVELIKGGKFEGTLTSPRSAKEYGGDHNGAEGAEGTCALDVGAGTLKSDDVLSALDKGLYVSNLWYTNFSDKKSCRVTGMTRFATFWVEGGQIKAPVNVMRFDDSIYRILGDELEALTADRELILDPDTYFNRKTSSARLPGALVKKFALTL